MNFFNLNNSFKQKLPNKKEALPGRNEAVLVTELHYSLKTPLIPPFPEHCETVLFGMGCFWGAEKRFWKVGGVYTTAVGYAGGYTANPLYEEVCSGRTGHNEVVLLVYDPDKLSFDLLLKLFWEGHDPTQGMRQGNDVGTQYRSGIYCTTNAQFKRANQFKDNYQKLLDDKKLGIITTEIIMAANFYYAEGYHQQYLAKNPDGYCGLGGLGVTIGGEVIEKRS